MDEAQERVAKEGLYEQAIMPPEEQDLTPEGQRIAHNIVVRLVRGVAGSGKTLVLSKRAQYLAEVHPDWKILVVTFNRPLASNLKRNLQGFQDRIK